MLPGSTIKIGLKINNNGMVELYNSEHIDTIQVEEKIPIKKTEEPKKVEDAKSTEN